MINVLFNDTLNAILNPPFKAEFNTNVKPSLKQRFVFLDCKWFKVLTVLFVNLRLERRLALVGDAVKRYRKITLISLP